MSTYIIGPCAFCKQDNARPYCTMNENWRTCDKHSQHLANELAKARELIRQFIEGSELLFDDLRSLRSSRICDARDNAKKYLENK